MTSMKSANGESTTSNNCHWHFTTMGLGAEIFPTRGLVVLARHGLFQLRDKELI